MLNDKDVVALIAGQVYNAQVILNDNPLGEPTVEWCVEKAYEIHTAAAARVVRGETPEAEK